MPRRHYSLHFCHTAASFRVGPASTEHRPLQQPRWCHPGAKGRQDEPWYHTCKIFLHQRIPVETSGSGGLRVGSPGFRVGHRIGPKSKSTNMSSRPALRAENHRKKPSNGREKWHSLRFLAVTLTTCVEYFSTSINEISLQFLFGESSRYIRQVSNTSPGIYRVSQKRHPFLKNQKYS